MFPPPIGGGNGNGQKSGEEANACFEALNDTLEGVLIDGIDDILGSNPVVISNLPSLKGAVAPPGVGLGDVKDMADLPGDIAACFNSCFGANPQMNFDGCVKTFCATPAGKAVPICKAVDGIIALRECLLNPVINDVVPMCMDIVDGINNDPPDNKNECVSEAANANIGPDFKKNKCKNCCSRLLEGSDRCVMACDAQAW